MAQEPEDVKAKVEALEARVAALEAKVHPSNICIYAGQEYSEGSVVKQDNTTRTCTRDFMSGNYIWK